MNFSHKSPFDLKGNPWNSNVVERPAFEKLKKSMERHGSFKPVVIRTLPDGTFQILGGFHRNEAAKELGWKEVPTFDVGEISDSRAKEIALLDNTRYGTDDEELLDKLLSEIEDLDVLAEILPETVELELPDVIDETEKMAEEIMERKEPDDTHKTLHFKYEIEKAEEIEAILSETAMKHGYQYSDGYSNFAEALYHLLVLEGK